MEKTVELINLKSRDGQRRREYPVEQAAGILKYEAQQGYKGHKLPEDSKFIFENGELIERPSAQTDKGAIESARNKSRPNEADKA